MSVSACSGPRQDRNLSEDIGQLAEPFVRRSSRRQTMPLFELVKITLDALYEEAKKAYGKDTDKEITLRRLYLL